MYSSSARCFVFLVGAIWAPAPNNSEQFLATKCYDPKGEAGDGNSWFQPRGSNKCHSIDKIADEAESSQMTADNVVFAVQMPLPRYGKQLDYSRWQQNLIGVLTADIEYQEEDDMEERVIVFLDAKLGYRNKGDKDGDWKEYARSFEARNLDCMIDEDKRISGGRKSNSIS